jgi:DNA polymerase
MGKLLFLDCETFSECDLKKAGTHRYAQDPSTEVTVIQWAWGDGEPMVVDRTNLDDIDEWVANEAIITVLREVAEGKRPELLGKIVVHNSFFDRTLIREVLKIDIPVEYFCDTMVQAMAHSLPGGLGKAGLILGAPLDEQKDKRGGELIRLFCKPRPANQKLRRATRHTHPDEWAEFIEYSRQDIPAMRAIHKRLPKWNYRPHEHGTPGGREYALWCLDQRINDRGMHMDLDLAAAAVRTAQRVKADLREQVSEATDGAVSSATKRDALLKYLLAEHGVDLPDLSSDTLKRRLEDPELPEHIKVLLVIRLEASMGSASKYQVALNATSEDGRLRGTSQFAGAQRTTRWAHRLFQPGNMKRPDKDMKKRIPQIIEATKLDVLDLVETEPMRAMANAVRGCITAARGRKLVIADLSNIEGRKLAWLAGEQWKLDAFAAFDRGEGEDLYKVTYGRSFDIDPTTVDEYQRQIGKVLELGLGYQGSVGAFLTFAAVYNLDLDELARAVWEVMDKAVLEEAAGLHAWTLKKRRSTFGLERDVWVACQALVLAWRAAHPATVQLWKDAEEAMLMAARNEGVTFEVGQHIKVQRTKQWTRVRLPSGRCLCYLHLQADDAGKLTYAGVNQYTRQWGRIKTYGGKICENIDQASSRDVLAWNMPAAEEAGYPIILSVHDELVTEPEDDERFAWRGLADIMATVPPWAEGLPLSAAGFETDRYRKD